MQSAECRVQNAECRMQSDNPSVNLAVDSSLYTREPKSKSLSAYTVKVKVKIKILLPYYGSKLNMPPLCKGRWQTSLATGDGGIVITLISSNQSYHFSYI